MTGRVWSERRAILQIDPSWLVRFFKGEGEQAFVITDNRLPADAQLLDVYYDSLSGMLRLLLTSEEFEIVPPAVSTPILAHSFGYFITRPKS